MNISFGRLRAPSGELLHLDFLRFVAAAGIVFHHSKEFFSPVSERAATVEQSAGIALFVDLFFVISGYVISYVYSERMRSGTDFIEFIRRRIGRLVPLHWITLLFSMAVWAVLIRIGGKANHAPAFTAKCVALTAALLHAGVPCGGEPFNGQSWSISAEMAMYVAFPLICFSGLRLRVAPFLLGIATLATLLAVACVQPAETVVTWTELHAYLRALPSFLIGVGLWFIRGQLARFPSPEAVLWVSLICLCAAMGFRAHVAVVLALVYLVASAAIAADLQGRSSTVVSAIAPLGQLTYSIYMWHGVLILLFMNALGDKLLHGGLGIQIPLAALTYTMLLVGGYYSFLYLETPARRWIDGIRIFEIRGVANRVSSRERT